MNNICKICKFLKIGKICQFAKNCKNNITYSRYKFRKYFYYCKINNN